MTKEDAIAYGNRVIDLGLNDETQAFCELALEALEQEPCGDSISRQAVLNKIFKFSVTDGKSVSVSNLLTEINELPPVKPQYTEVEIQKMEECYDRIKAESEDRDEREISNDSNERF